MKKWQEERNYRRIYNEAGEVIANIITVDGVDVEVAEDVYLAYSQADRRERYVREEQFSGKILSLEQMAEDDLLSDYVGAEAAPSAEEEALEREQAASLAEQKKMLLLAMLSLNDADRELINALFFDGASTRDYAAQIGITVKEIAPHALQPEHLRVAAYCRVSSDSEDQLHSYAAQIRNYTEVIAQHDGWDLVDVYADEGLTGTRVDKRDDFNRMMRDCRKGKIDCILVKSVARFARNTKECLASLRELSGMGVTVRFEKENIDTGTLTTELMVSVSGSLAQQESLSISANQRLSYQHRMECGEFITCSAPYGYRIKDKKNLEILPEEAAAVRWAFDAYLKGNSSKWIAEQLTAKGIPTQNGAEKWQETSIRYLLTNEKYIGDTLCQKSYSCGFPFVQKRNRGERMQYYVENSHPAIIDRDTFEKVQELLRKKAQKEKRRRERSPFALKILCGNCGTMFLRRTSKNGYVTWVCRTHDRSADACHVGRIPESEIRAAFLRMYRKLKCNADMILKPAMEQMNALDAILQQNNPKTLTINRAIAEATEESHKISTLRVNGLLDADTCTARMNVISAKLAQLRRERRRLAENEALDEVMDALRKVRQTILDGPEQMDDFDDDLFESLVEKIIAESQTEIRFRLYGGLELRERLEVAVR